MMSAISSRLNSSMVDSSSASRVLGVNRLRCAWARFAVPVSSVPTGSPNELQISWNA